MDPAEALDRIGFLLEGDLAPGYRVRAFRNAAATVRELGTDRVRELADAGRLRELDGIGEKTAGVIEQALAGSVPDYLANLQTSGGAKTASGRALVDALRGDCHSHSTWSDGGASIRAMAEAAIELGHEYLVVTDHSQVLEIANGLSAAELATQLDEIAELNAELAPFRILTGMEVDILEDGGIDMDPGILAELDVVVGSVHRRFKQGSEAMTRRMVAALMSPNVDILGHCTGRKIAGGYERAESEFDHEMVFAACAELDKAVEINCRPERLDPPRRLLRLAADFDCRFAIDSDAHAPGQLVWQSLGSDRAAECEIDADRIVNTWPIDDLLAWTASHAS